MSPTRTKAARKRHGPWKGHPGSYIRLAHLSRVPGKKALALPDQFRFVLFIGLTQPLRLKSIRREHWSSAHWHGEAVKGAMS
jgi:hypothetical protein